MNKYSELMRDAATHLRACSGDGHYPVAARLDDAAAELEQSRPVAFACQKPKMLQWAGGINIGDPLYLHPPTQKRKEADL